MLKLAALFYLGLVVLAMVLNVARTPLPEGATPPLKAFPG